MKRTVRDSYAGIDPLVIDLVQRVIDLEERCTELEGQRPQALEKSNTSDGIPDVEKWTGKEFVELFLSLYQAQYGQDYECEFLHINFPKGKVTVFLNQHDTAKYLYYEYVQWLIHEDPWVQNGALPQMGRMWNNNMYNIFLSKRRHGIKPSETRNLDGTFQVVVGDESPELQEALKEQHRKLWAGRVKKT